MKPNPFRTECETFYMITYCNRDNTAFGVNDLMVKRIVICEILYNDNP